MAEKELKKKLEKSIRGLQPKTCFWSLTHVQISQSHILCAAKGQSIGEQSSRCQPDSPCPCSQRGKIPGSEAVWNSSHFSGFFVNSLAKTLAREVSSWKNNSCDSFSMMQCWWIFFSVALVRRWGLNAWASSKNFLNWLRCYSLRNRKKISEVQSPRTYATAIQKSVSKVGKQLCFWI